jgi:rRNA maturation RNase YbeY
MIHIVTSSRYKINKPRIKKVVGSLLADNGMGENVNVNCIFIGKTKMREIASKYKKEDVALPVLSFSYLDENMHDTPLLGEVFLCYPQIILLAAERNKRVEDMIDAMIIHGVSNLLKN